MTSNPEYSITWTTDRGTTGCAIEETPWKAEQKAFDLLGAETVGGTIVEVSITDHNGNTDYFEI